jgi:hypothetical protein
MVIPEEREQDFERKMKSPLFSEHFEKDNWTLAYFNALREAFTKTKGRTNLESLFGKKRHVNISRREAKNSENQVLFELPESGGTKTSSSLALKDDTIAE